MAKQTPRVPSVIEQRRIDTLIPYARNARTHSDAQVAQLAASIREFGWTNPVLVALDYADIDRAGARMYRGNRLVSIVDAPPDQGGEAGIAEHGAPTVDTFKRTTP